VARFPRDEVIAVLAAWPYEEPRDLPPGSLGAWEDGVVLLPEGSFECTVGRAFDEGLLSDEDYHAISRRDARVIAFGVLIRRSWTQWVPATRPG
jgi:hypothetical protein